MNINILGSFLPGLLNEKVAVKIATGKVYTGILEGFDSRMNILISKCMINNCSNRVLIRCSSIVSVSNESVH
ncbi:hypothetical protein NEPAR06_0540 [Nematocida parisii]|uniref:Sm domain-containing protein n=1 Tax=Nematocida parisii (strain ERTm3) TaxID=935791 RepID=I3EI33_NEMP3|nr:uncharacterized protein NEPG_01909 [Nematocida parisii ERTm1]EIJ88880.1 hypothetical protein NEQG_00699 [Nematocida parisii ERTm3]KAI5126249.1 hypothetical protein NEPAR08_0320 [Nematocida parisii]EIJ93567.1 hypothetical protein NEPG_01909 [Nematocida parisii ERTm1]KAI5127116.1 hypothetical protein NEPAR03_0783 [Nematocida parisii]KAI5140039.1 hypothetical protein NEPAR04_0013 [Nematocida parisii]|eukprot:XP_013059737.1 hypothetical protein NEPG_01909 [Nematocida parisii ERTm1]